MKSFKTVFIAMIAMLTFNIIFAQSNKAERNTGIKTASIKVYGNCGMDKNRIEKNANAIAGVKSAKWDEHTLMLTLSYSAFNKNAADEVQKKVAAAGNDTEKYRADDAVYQSLPDCCHYERKNLNHLKTGS